MIEWLIDQSTVNQSIDRKFVVVAILTFWCLVCKFVLRSFHQTGRNFKFEQQTRSVRAEKRRRTPYCRESLASKRKQVTTLKATSCCCLDGAITSCFWMASVLFSCFSDLFVVFSCLRVFWLKVQHSISFCRMEELEVLLINKSQKLADFKKKYGLLSFSIVLVLPVEWWTAWHPLAYSDEIASHVIVDFRSRDKFEVELSFSLGLKTWEIQRRKRRKAAAPQWKKKKDK